MRTVGIKLHDALVELMDQLVEEKRYPSRSALIRYAIIDLLRREGKI